jgi:hypothetical protein
VLGIPSSNSSDNISSSTSPNAAAMLSSSISKLSGQNEGVGNSGMSSSYGSTSLGNTPDTYPMSLSNSHGKDGNGSSFKSLAGI